MKKQTLVSLVVISGLLVAAVAGCSKPPQTTQADLVKAQKASASADARVRSRPAAAPRTEATRPQMDSSGRSRN